jgi:hypothetical protein
MMSTRIPLVLTTRSPSAHASVFTSSRPDHPITKCSRIRLHLHSRMYTYLSMCQVLDGPSSGLWSLGPNLHVRPSVSPVHRIHTIFSLPLSSSTVSCSTPAHHKAKRGMLQTPLTYDMVSLNTLNQSIHHIYTWAYIHHEFAELLVWT